MTEREMLELAAKAAGINLADHQPVLARDGQSYLPPVLGRWNPLENDGDALRLAVKLRLSIIQEEEFLEGVRYPTVEVMSEEREDGSRICAMQSLEVDASAATRLAIVRAAAAIQQAKEAQ